ncbi:glutamate--cysteine ligase, partial [Roseateles sp. GG27B]
LRLRRHLPSTTDKHESIADRGADENLSAPGASFVPLAFSQASQLPRPGEKPGVSGPNRFYMYGVIARLAMLAASYELEVTDPDAEVYT